MNFYGTMYDHAQYKLIYKRTQIAHILLFLCDLKICRLSGLL